MCGCFSYSVGSDILCVNLSLLLWAMWRFRCIRNFATTLSLKLRFECLLFGNTVISFDVLKYKLLIFVFLSWISMYFCNLTAIKAKQVQPLQESRIPNILFYFFEFHACVHVQTMPVFTFRPCKIDIIGSKATVISENIVLSEILVILNAILSVV